ncbi:S-layer homology domain-containing protein [Paenibacillus sp. 1P07SE]|uniref:S-layer homology domain-containing protein n=1 Tax=Paenibacillus sp. 1P07SE TaxID=3132209 RepID=UPI0039A68F48
MQGQHYPRVIAWLIIAVLLGGLALPAGPAAASDTIAAGVQVNQTTEEVVVGTALYNIRIEKAGFRYSFEDAGGGEIAPAHPVSGIRFGSAAGATLYDAETTELLGYDEESIRFRVVNTNGDEALVRILPYERYARFQIEPEPFEERSQALQGEAPERVEALIWRGDTTWDDYTLELEMKQSKRDASSTSGVLVRYQDYDNFYHLRYHLATNKLQLLKKQTGSALSVIHEVNVSGAFDSARLYPVKVEAEGNRIRAYWNNSLLLDYTDEQSPLLTGAVGMRIYSDVTKYANVSVTAGDTVLMDESDWQGTEDWHVHNGQWRMTGEVTRTAVIDARTGSLSPGYGLGDYAHNQQSTNVFGISNHDLTNKGADQRFVSTFTVFPAHGFAQVLFETGKKRVAVNSAENKLGADNVASVDGLYYFMGTMEQIYADYQEVRVAEGYPVYKPKYDFFEVGYEAFGSLGWNTYQTSVMQDLQTYLDKGYKLKWGVVGSGFWKGDRNAPTQGATTSFGLWDDVEGPPRADGLPNPRYPDVDGLKAFFRDNDMNLLLGLRTNFKALPTNGGNYTPAHDGPFTEQGLERGYFLKDENGTPLKYTVSFPNGSVHLLDTYNEEALDWYEQGADLWGVDGFKEDTMMMTKPYEDGLWNRSNGRLMEQGYQVMVRNAAYSVPGDILRLEDTQHAYNQDRPIINALNYAASGAPNVYSDIVAGKYLTLPLTQDQKLYFVRNAMWAAMTPAMSLGLGPWHMENETYEAAVKKAVDFHSMYAPYIYSAVVDSYHTGFPHTMTPLPIAYPDDPQTYQLANRTTRQYEWMLGPSMLAVPAYGHDYASVTARDVYLPAGTWIDYESGERYQGPMTLERYSLPIDKIPVFIGGKGVVVRQELNNGRLLAEVYPVADQGSTYTYTYPDGEATSTIVNGNDGWNPATLHLVDTTADQEIAYDYDERTGAFAFELTPGHDYELTGGTFEGTLAELLLPEDQPAELIAGERLQLQVEARADSGEPVELSELALAYETEDAGIVAVSEAGLVTPLQTGTTRVRVSADGPGGRLFSPWLTLTVVEAALAIEAPAHLAVWTDESVVVSGTSRGLAQLELRYQGDVREIAQQADGAWETTLGRLANGPHSLQVVGRDKDGRIRLAQQIRIELDTEDTLLVSDFTDTSEPWQIVNGNWSLSETDGRDVYRATGRGLTHAGPADWRDYRVEADLMMAASASGGSAGLVFRYSDPANFYHVRLDDNRSSEPGVRTIQLYKWVDGAASKVAEAPFAYEYGQWYTMAVEVEGDRIQAFVDGERYLDVTDASLVSGAVGLRTYDRHTSVDAVRVTRLAPEERSGYAVWQDGAAEVREAEGASLTLAWSGQVQGVEDAQYRVWVNNEPMAETTTEQELVIDGLARGELYSFKVEAGAGERWSTDGPVVVHIVPDGEGPGEPGEPGEPGNPGNPSNPGVPYNPYYPGGWYWGESGGDDGSEGTGSEQPEPGPDVLTVTDEELARSDRGRAEIILSAAQQTVRLPIGAAQLDYPIAVRTAAGDTVIIDPLALAAMLADVSTGAADFFRLELTASDITAGQRGQLGSELRLMGSGTVQLDLALSLTSGELVHSPLSGDVRLELAYDTTQADAALLGLYRYDTGTGAWVYAGGHAEASTVTGAAAQPGLYAVLQREISFADVPQTHWAHRTLQVLAARHIVSGMSETQFVPSGLTTRAEFTALLVRALGLEGDASASALAFSDVAQGAWYAAEVAAAYEAGLVQGVSAGRFDPQAQITREQMAVMIVRAFELAGGQTPDAPGGLEQYSDRTELSSWAADAAAQAVAAGLMQGTATDTFDPLAQATRAQTAQAIYNLLAQVD